MNLEKKDPVKAELNRKETRLTGDARIALNSGEVTKAMSLIEQITGFWGGNLITLMSVAVFQSKDDPMEHRAKELFYELLDPGRTGGAADQNHLVDVFGRQARVL